MMDPLKTLCDYARFPSVSTDPAFADGMAGARAFAIGLLEQLGFQVTTVEPPSIRFY